ncbi:alpha/beta hydrolase [Paenibacillus sp. CECT 9249]|nr:alpha/beta hydrolase [Paenibacillus sp. CECT 9249]
MSNLFTPEISWKDRFRFVKGFSFSNRYLWQEFLRCNLFAQIPEVHTPVYFITGRHDRICFLLERYASLLEAPQIELVVFERSGHLACFEEPDKFNEFLIRRVRKEIVP